MTSPLTPVTSADPIVPARILPAVGSDLPRAQITCPVVAAVPPTADTIFADHDPSSAQKYYLPRWQVNTERTTGQPRYWVSMDPVANQDAWTLSVHIIPVTDSHIDSRLADQSLRIFENLTTPAVALQYKHPTAGNEMRLAFDSVVAEPNGAPGYHATLTISNIAQRDEIHAAMTKPDLQCSLVVVPSVTVAFQVPAGIGPWRPFPFIIARPWIAGVAGGARPFIHAAMPINGRPVIVGRPPIMIHPPIMVHPPIGPVRPLPPPPPQPPPEPLFRASTFAIDCPLPFIFDGDLNKYIFQHLGVDGGDKGSALNMLPVKYGGATYTYFQPSSMPSAFFYLPDAFKICRREHPPCYPAMTATVGGTYPDNVTVMLTYTAVPVTDPKRIADAKGQLASFGVSQDGAPLSTADVELDLALPGGASGASPYAQRTGVKPDLGTGFSDAFTLSLDQFTSLFDSFFSDAGLFFQGKVIVKTGDNSQSSVPFTARASDMVAFELFARTRTIDPASQGVRVDFKNATEATLHVPDSLAPVLVGGDGTPIAGSVVGVSPALPCDLAPAGADGQGGGILTLIMASSAGTTDPAADIAIDVGQIGVSSDREALWNAIVASGVGGQATRTVHVQAASGPFEKRDDGHYLESIEVEFDSGRSVTLAPPSCAADVVVPVSITDYLLRKTVGPEYRYKCGFLYHDGASVPETDWITESRGTLFVAVPAKPGGG
jgi:hypothetical protein